MSGVTKLKADTNDLAIKKQPSKPSFLQRNLYPDIANAITGPCVVVMVGLPARGKTYMSRKLARYLNWIGIETKVFNVGEYRRKLTAARNYKNVTADFFRPDNEEARVIRDLCSKEALDDLITWLKDESGDVAVYDATNATRERRRWLYDILYRDHGFKVLYVESLCTNTTIVEENIREVKISSPDYLGVDAAEAIFDFKQRISSMESEYETIDEQLDRDLSYLKIYDQGDKYLVNRVQGHVHSRVVYYLMNIRVLPRTIYITRHGETDMNDMGRIGGDGNLSERGQQYARALGQYITNEQSIKKDLHIWTSLMKRTIQTVALVDAPKEHWKALNEIDAGVCEGLTYTEIEEQYPEDFRRRDQNKYHYRYPGGESYEDLVMRLEPVIMELERQQNVLVVCHQAVARCLLSYFLDINQDELPYIRVPLHTVIKLTPVAYGCRSEHVKFDIDAVDTYRPRPATIIPTTAKELKEWRKKNMDGIVNSVH